MICKKCGRDNLGPDDFHKDRSRENGLQKYCKDCRNSSGYNQKRYQEKREELLEKSKKY